MRLWVHVSRCCLTKLRSSEHVVQMVQRTHTPVSSQPIFMVYYPTYSNFDGLEQAIDTDYVEMSGIRGALRHRKLVGPECWTCRSLILAA